MNTCRDIAIGICLFLMFCIVAGMALLVFGWPL
jgi:hypothetical protein